VICGAREYNMGKTYKDKREFWDTSRDIYQLMLIQGVTKANVHKDRKRESNKKKCRDAVDSDRGEW
jgi:hypothetical protein